mmetsp:Transcript_5997/g.8478  ORF Transcript_5997/g.8478 Transcript_5997/m.8478 type:complete len:205 (-) Transcript_5997:169-783(-)
MVFFIRLALLTSLANSFVIQPNRHHFIGTTTKLASVKELDPIDLMCIEDVAEFCLGRGQEECDVEDLIATTNQLDDQDHILHSKIDELDHLLFRLRTEGGVHDEHSVVNPEDIHLVAKHQLEPMDLMCVENAAEFCLSEYGECSLEDNEAIVNQLKDQRDLLLKEAFHVERLMKDLNQYTSVFAKDDEEIDSLMGSISDALQMN